MSVYVTSPFTDRDTVAHAVNGASSVREALERMGYTGRLHKYYPMLKQACTTFGLKYPAHSRTRKVKPKRYSVFSDKEAIKSAVESSSSRLQILKKLGVAPAQRNYVSLEKAAIKFSIKLPDKVVKNYPTDRKGSGPGFFDRETFVNAVNSSESGNEVIRRLGVARDRSWLVRAAKFHGVELPVGTRGKGGSVGKPLEDILVENSTYTSSSSSLKKRLVSSGMLDNVCSSCGLLPEWMGKPLSLQLDHINGIHNDNRLSNLRILCPNCHSQSPTYAGRNRKIQ